MVKQRKRDTSASIIIGKNVSAGLVSFKGADLTVARYVGRVDTSVEADVIRDSLVAKGVHVVSLDKLKNNHNRFASFKLVVKKSQLSIVEDASFWPEGVIVGRWWAPKSTESAKELTGNG